ncbi:MAG: type II toxin-antitoxin system HicB family antitoxin [Planctomycetes bacterium]|nr:type II toxin-antitoxin system HicB family antitoxin [Planctomycetota bacterium]
MKVRVVIDYDPDVRSYSVFCPELPGCASRGETEKEAMENIREAIALYLEPTPIASGPTRKVRTVGI